MRIPSFIVFTGLVQYPITSQATPDDLFFELPVVLSATRLEQPISETPIAVTIIDRQMIVASGARNIPDILYLGPGMLIGHSLNEFGDEPRVVVAYHGHSDQYSRQMQVLIDGRSIYEPVLGGVNWNNIPVNIDDIERIEVIRGPNASTYGSNSFLAVINIITRHAAEDTGHYVRTNIGHNDITDATYRFADQFGDLDYRFTITSYNDSGQETINGAALRDDVGTNTIDYRFDYQINSNSQLTYQGGYSDSTQQARASTRPGSFNPDRDIDNLNAYQFFRYENTLNQAHSIKAQYYYNLFDKTDVFSVPLTLDPIDLNEDINNLLGLPSIAMGTLSIDTFDLNNNESFKSERHNIEITHYFTPDNDLRLIWGIGAQQDSGESTYYFGSSSNRSRNIYRAFSNIESKITDAINFNVGALWENSDLVGSNVSPRASLIGKITPQHSLRASYSEAIRTLFLAEQFADITLNADTNVTVDVTFPIVTQISQPVSLISDILRSTNPLVTERIISREIGYYGRFADDDLLISARIFRNSLSNLIDATAVPSDIELSPGEDGLVDVFNNLYSTTIKGLELELDYNFNSSLRLISNASLLDIEGNFDPSDATPTNDISRLEESVREYHHSAPDHAFTLMAIKKFSELYTGSFSFHYIGDMAWLDANRTSTREGRRNTGGYRKLDMRLARNWSQHNTNYTLALVLQNAYEDYSNYDASPHVVSSAAEQNLTGYIELRMQHH